MKYCVLGSGAKPEVKEVKGLTPGMIAADTPAVEVSPGVGVAPARVLITPGGMEVAGDCWDVGGT